MKLIHNQTINFFLKLKNSSIYKFTFLFLVSATLGVILQCINNQFFVPFYLIALVSSQLSIFKYGIFKTYIYRAYYKPDSDSITLVIASGILKPKLKRLYIKNKNFNIKYYRNPKKHPVFVIEQIKPFKTVVTQYCIGAWKDRSSMDILKPFVNKAIFND
jgi:hypothetical protein